MPAPPFPPTPWLTILGGGVAFIVSLIAFLVASGLLKGQPRTPSTRRPTSR